MARETGPATSGWWPMWWRPPDGRREPPRCARVWRSSLPDYMVPSAFVVLEALPLTPNGKLDRRALPARTCARRPSRARRAPRRGDCAGCSPRCSGCELVGVDDNFFEARRPFAAGDAADQPDPRHARMSRSPSGRCSKPPVWRRWPTRLIRRKTNRRQPRRLDCGLGQRKLAARFLHSSSRGVRLALLQAHPSYSLSGHPIYALQARNLIRRRMLPETINEMAADYLRIIRKVQP